MKDEFIESLKQLKKWCANKNTNEIKSEILNFDISQISDEDINKIKTYTEQKLPESYYSFLKEIGIGRLFYDTTYRGGGIEIFDLDALIENNKIILSEIESENEPTKEQFIMIGIHHAMGDWFGFDVSKVGISNFDVFCHEYPIYEYGETSDELKSWRSFEDWVINLVASKGENSL
jgi:SMI1 / KNR4 family (SUKH-1)